MQIHVITGDTPQLFSDFPDVPLGAWRKRPSAPVPQVIFELRLFFDVECQKESQLTPFFTDAGIFKHGW